MEKREQMIKSGLDEAESNKEEAQKLKQQYEEALSDAKQEAAGIVEKARKRSQEEHKRLVNRLSRVEGQIRGIKKMVEEDAYCIDILIQVAAANAALNSFNKELLAEHIRTCVADDIKNGREETIEELVATLQKLMK